LPIEGGGGDEREAPFPFCLTVGERSSPSRVRYAAHDPRSARVPRRALDCSGPFPKTSFEKGKGANGNACGQALPGRRIQLIGS
jgi:hypothetical protein